MSTTFGVPTRNRVPNRRYCTVHIIDPGRLCKKSQSKSAIAYRDNDPSRGKHKPRTKVQHTTKLASRTLVAINQSQRISKYNIDRLGLGLGLGRPGGNRAPASWPVQLSPPRLLEICLRLARSGSTESISNRPGLFFLFLYSASDSESILSFPSVSVRPI